MAAASSEPVFEENKRQRTFDLSMWEDPFLDDLGADKLDFHINNEKQDPPATLKTLTAKLITRLTETIANWEPPPSQRQVGALSIVGLYLDMASAWDPKSDFLLARLVGLLGGTLLRAHPDSCYTLTNGSWLPCKTVPQHMIIHMEESVA